MVLYIFDFDDTLAHTNSHVRVISADGTTIRLNSREFAKYRSAPGDALDFSEFNRAEGNLINDTVLAMESAIRDVGIENVYIVTARAEAEPVEQFLSSMGVSTPGVVATMGSAGKATWLSRVLMQGNYSTVMVYEDCRKNITMLKDIVEAYNEEMRKSVEYRAICILPSGTQEIIETIDYMNEGLIDYVQGGLDVVGFIPGAGEIADAINALISIARGNVLDALLSGISLIPVAGDVAGKSGKVIMKVFGPAVDLIKSGGKVSEIVSKIGVDKIKKITPVLETFKNTIVKYRDEIKKVFEAIVKGDVKAIEKMMGMEVPSMAKNKFSDMLKAAGKKLEEMELETLVEFFAELDIGGEDEEMVEESIHRLGLAPAILGENYVKEHLLSLADDLSKIRNSKSV